MKRHLLNRAVHCTAAAGLAMILASCDQPPPGLGKSEAGEDDAGGKEKSAYSDLSGNGTASAAPAAGTPVVTAHAPPPASAPAASAGTITIKPDMPQFLFVGTPLPADNAPPNLDKSDKATLEVEVPPGVNLISKGKPVSCSDAAPIGALSLITDGDKDGNDGCYVDILPGKHWVQLDLGESKEIHLLWVWHFHKAAVYYKDVVAQISDDPGFKTSTTVFNNDFDNSSGFGEGKDQSWVETNNGRPMPVKGVKGRYVRLWSNGRSIDDTNHYIEVEVYREVIP